MVDIRLPSGQIITNVPEGLSREQVKQKIIESGVLRRGEPYQEPTTLGEQFGRGLTGAARQAAQMVPLVGGYAEDVEAAARSLVGPETRQEELAKIRGEMREQEALAERYGTDPLVTGAQIAGGIAASIPVFRAVGAGLGALQQAGGRLAPLAQRSQQFAQTRLGQSALGGAVGGIEAAGFADEQAARGATVGAGVGAAVPVVGRGLARAFGLTTKTAGKPIAEIAQTDKGAQTMIKGIDASPRLAEEVRPIAQSALENTERRVQNETLKALDVESLGDIAAPARREYSDFMEKNADKLIPMKKAQNLYKSRNINSLAEQIRANNPDTFGQMPVNSIGFLQEVKSRAAARGRGASELAPDYREASNKIKGFIDNNFAGFKDLNKKYAKMVDSEKLADKFVNPRAGETGNIAKSLLTTQNKRDLVKNFGSKKAARLVKALRKESEAHKNLSSITTKARNRAQDRGSMNVLLGGGGLAPAATRIATYVGAGALDPKLAAAVGGVDLAAGLTARRGARRAAERALRGGVTPRVSPMATTLTAQQLGRLGGQ